MLTRILLGEDIFISYSRADGANYAAGLAAALTERGFACKFDQWGSVPGRTLPASLRKAVGRAAVLVLVATRGARDSVAVAEEIRIFKRTKRPIVPVDLHDTFRGSSWIEDVVGLAVSVEGAAAAESGNPSEEVLNRIEHTFTFTRKDQRVRRTYGASAVFLGLLLIAAVIMTLVARRESRLATEGFIDLHQEQGRLDLLRGEYGSAYALLAAALHARPESDAIRLLLARAEKGLSVNGPAHSFIASGPRFSPDGSLVATSSVDAVRVWSSTTGDTVARIADGGAAELAFVGNDRMVTAAFSGGLRLWDLGSGRLLEELRTGSKIVRIDVDPERAEIVAVDEAGTVHVQELLADGAARTYAATAARSEFTAARFSGDGTRVIGIAEDRLVVWDRTSGAVIVELASTDPRTRWWGFAVSGDARHAGAVLADGKVLLAGLENGRRDTLTVSDGTVAKLEFAAAAGTFFIATQTGNVDMFAVADSAPPQSVGSMTGVGALAAVDPSGTYLIDAEPRFSLVNPPLKIRDTENGALLRSIRLRAPTVAVSPDGRRFAVTQAFDSMATVWHVRTDGLHANPRVQPYLGNVRIGPGSTRILALGSGTAAIFDPYSGRRLLSFGEDDDPVVAAGFRGTDSLLVTLQASGRLTEWEDGSRSWSLDLGADFGYAEFDPSGNHLVLCRERGGTLLGSPLCDVVLFELTTGDRRQLASGARHPRIALGGEGVVVQFDSAAVLIRFDGTRGDPTPSSRVRAVSPAGDLEAVGVQGRIDIRSRPSADVVRTIAAYSVAVNGLAFSPSGHVLVSVGNDSTVDVWRVADGAMLLRSQTYTVDPVFGGSIDHVEMSPDGSFFVTWNEGDSEFAWLASMKVWDFTIERRTGAEVLAHARRRLPPHQLARIDAERLGIRGPWP